MLTSTISLCTKLKLLASTHKQKKRTKLDILRQAWTEFDSCNLEIVFLSLDLIMTSHGNCKNDILDMWGG